jgi:hypothetical protein
VLVAAAILCVAGCGLGESAEEALRRPATVAGCWGAPEEFRNADITAITLTIGGAERPSGDETIQGTLNFYATGQNSMTFSGEYKPATGKVAFEGETFEFSGQATEAQIYGFLYQTDDGTRINIAWEKEGKGCQGS